MTSYLYNNGEEKRQHKKCTFPVTQQGTHVYQRQNVFFLISDFSNFFYSANFQLMLPFMATSLNPSRKGNHAAELTSHYQTQSLVGNFFKVSNRQRRDCT